MTTKNATLRSVLCFVVASALVHVSAGKAHAHSGALEIRSTAPAGGALSVGPPTGEKIEMVQTVCNGGQCTYANNELAFLTPATSLPEQSLFPLKDGTLVRIEVVAADPGASLKLGAVILDGPGDSAVLGRAVTMHVHSSPVAIGPPGQIRDWKLVVRLTTGAKGYTDSAPITLTFTNAPATTTTTLPAATCGDGLVEGDEQCDDGSEVWSVGRACAGDCTVLGCGDVDGNGARAASDALFVLRVAVGARRCDACLCNVDGIGTTTTAADALRLLRFAVGAPGVELNCSACE